MGLRHLVHLGVIIFVNYQESVVIILVLSAVLEVHPLRSECRVCSLTWPPSQNLFSVTPRNPIMKPRANIPTPQFSHLAFLPLISKKNRHHIFDASQKSANLESISGYLICYSHIWEPHEPMLIQFQNDRTKIGRVSFLLKLTFGHENSWSEDQLRPAVTWLQSLPTPLSHTYFDPPGCVLAHVTTIQYVS